MEIGHVTKPTGEGGEPSLIATAVRAVGSGARMNEMMVATSYVIATRLGMIGAAFRSPLDGDYHELNRMMPEKVTAISRSGTAWLAGACELQRDMAAQFVDVGMMMLGGVPKPSRLIKVANESARLGARALLFPVVAGEAAMEPLHRTVTMNARRLRGAEARRRS